MPSLDGRYYLQGDEDCGVGMVCLLCDRGGLPIAYLTTAGDRTYEGTDVKVVYSIDEFLRMPSLHTHSG
jgi:hypothetical protein